MSLKLTATFVVADISFCIESDSVAGVRDAITELKTGAPAPSTDKAEAAASKPEAAKAGKSAKAEKPAASSPPAAETPKADTAASEKKVEASASTPAVTDYTKTGLPEKIAAYLGDKEAAGYAERRAELVKLLTSFNVKKGPELKPEQFAEFDVALTKLSAGAEEDLG